MPLSVIWPLPCPVVLLKLSVPLPVAVDAGTGNNWSGTSVSAKPPLFATVTLTLAELAVWPAESVITALIWWAPSATLVESQP